VGALPLHPEGRTLAGPVRAGEPVTDVRLVSPSLAAGYPGRVLVPVRIADADQIGRIVFGVWSKGRTPQQPTSSRTTR
jgi:hypothetical protein